MIDDHRWYLASTEYGTKLLILRTPWGEYHFPYSRQLYARILGQEQLKELREEMRSAGGDCSVPASKELIGAPDSAIAASLGIAWEPIDDKTP